MLLTFRVSNFLSFNKEEEFSMLAGQVKNPVSHVTEVGSGSGSTDVVRAALLYGANGSGKSNLIKSIDFARKVLVKGLKSTSMHNQHFRLEKNAEQKPSKFEFEFKAGEKVYAYGFVLLLNTKKVVEEWFFEVKKTKDKPIFERKVLPDGSSELTTRPSLKGKDATRFDIYMGDLLDDQLLLTELGEKKGENFGAFKDAFSWLENNLMVIWPDSNFSSLPIILQDEKARKLYCQLLEHFKTGIIDFDFKEINVDETLSNFRPEGRAKIEEGIENKGLASAQIGHKKVLLTKNNSGELRAAKLMTKHLENTTQEEIIFDFDDESDGTRRLFDLLSILFGLSIGTTPITYLIDEIDRSLHPELTRKFIEAFLNSNGQLGSQLILTTHESSLLDLNLLRRDEIWFVEKKNDGSSHLYSLEEFKPRFDTEIRKAYLQGRYGAIPFISDVSQLGWNQN